MPSSGSWAIETYLTLDTVNIIAASPMIGAFGIWDGTQNNGLGVLSQYVGVQVTNAGSPPACSVYWGATSQAGQALPLAQITLYTYAAGTTCGAYFRLVRDTSVSVSQPKWRAYYKLAANLVSGGFGRCCRPPRALPRDTCTPDANLSLLFSS